MNEDDIQIQTGTLSDDNSVISPAEPNAGQESTEGATPENSQFEEDVSADKVVDISDDFNITPVKDDQTSVQPPVLPSINQPGMNQLDQSPRPVATSQKVIRTYEGDVAEVLAHRKSSTVSIALAESRKNTGEDRLGSTEAPSGTGGSDDTGGSEAGESSHVGKKALIALISLILIGVGVVGAYYLYSISPLAPTSRGVPETQAVQSLVPRDAQTAISVDGVSIINIIRAVRAEIAKSQAPDTIKEIVLTQTKNGQHFRVTGPDMMNIMDIRAPDILLRALADNWMLGVYADVNGAKTVFVIATVDYFQNAFAGMLQWEGLMADDLKQYLYQNPSSDTTVAMPALPKAAVDAMINPLANIDSILPTVPKTTSVPNGTPAKTASTSAKAASSSSAQASGGRRGSFSEGTSGGSAQNVVTQGNPSSSLHAQMTSSTTILGLASTSAAIFGGTSQPYVILRGSFVDRIIHNKDVREFITSDGNILFLYSFIDNTKIVVTGSEAALSEILNRLERQAFVR